MSSGYVEMKVNERREELFDRIEDVVLPLISYTSAARGREESMRLGPKYVEMMREKKKELPEIDDEIQELQEKKKDIREKWETGQVTFDDI